MGAGHSIIVEPPRGLSTLDRSGIFYVSGKDRLGVRSVTEIISAIPITLSRVRMKPDSTAGARMWQVVAALGLADKGQRRISAVFGVSQSVVADWKAGRGGVDSERVLLWRDTLGVNAAFVLLAEGGPLLEQAAGYEYAAGFWDGRRDALLTTIRLLSEQAEADAARLSEARATDRADTIGDTDRGPTPTPRPGGTLELEQGEGIAEEADTVAPVPKPERSRKGRRRAQ